MYIYLNISFNTFIWIAGFVFLPLVLILCAWLFIKVKKLKQDKNSGELKINKLEYDVNKLRIENIDLDKLIVEKLKDEKERTWVADGISMFSDMLRQSENNLNQLAKSILSQIIKHLKVEIGGIWIKEKNDENKVIYRLNSSIAFDKDNIGEKEVFENEQLVGACGYDKQTTYIKDLPDSYLSVSSGLGNSKPKYLLLIPLLYNNSSEGIIEIASFYEIEKFKIKFLEEIGEKIAATIINVKANENNQKLLTDMENQSLEIQSRESELRRNLLELQESREETLLREEKLEKQIKVLKEKIEELKKR